MKRSTKPKTLELLLFSGLITVLGFACNVREPGCLDIEAENFDFEAERHDPSICDYPDLVLNVQYQWTDSSLQTGFLYRNAHGMDYALHGVQLMFSKFILQNDLGEELTVDEPISITTGDCGSGNVIVVPDDFVFVDRTAFNYPLGPFRTSGAMVHVQSHVGVPDAYTPMCRDLLPSSHILRSARAEYNEELEVFALGRFIISRDSVQAIRDTILIYAPSSALDYDINRTFRQGKPDTISMAIDFHQLFDPLDLNQDSASISAEIASRIASAVTIR